MLALVIVVDQGDVELVSDAVWALGVVAIEERAGTQAGTIELWTSLGDDQDAVTAAVADIPNVQAWWFEHVDDSVVDTWRHTADATWVDDDLVVYPAWLEPAPATDGIAISIEPGSTFGLGDHPTTILSMRALRSEIRPGARVLDVGCGSGVLSIAAVLFGAGDVEAIDISPAAVPVTLANAVRNDVSDRVHVSNAAPADLDGEYDVIVANILAPALISLSGDLVRLLAGRGKLIVSGLLAERHDHVLAALAPLRQIGREDLRGWTAITLGRDQAPLLNS